MDLAAVKLHTETLRVKNIIGALNESQIALLHAHLEFVLEANKTHNLTRITDEKEALTLHLEDSLTAIKHVIDQPQGPIIDIGTGGGFPGVPIAIVSNRPCVLLDARSKKIGLLKCFLDEQKLNTQITATASRIEEYSLVNREKYAIVTARAVSSLQAIMELSQPLLMLGGVLIAYKANMASEELRMAQKTENVLGMIIEKQEKLLLTDGATNRTLVIVRKTGESKVCLPRRDGMAQKKALM